MREVTPADVERVRHTVYSVPAAYKIGLDDAVGEGMLGLWKATLSFDESRGVVFWSYAHRYVVGEVLEAARRADHLTRWQRAAVKAGRREDHGTPLYLEELAAGGWDWEDTVGADRGEDVALRMTLDEAVTAVDGRCGAVLRLWLADVPQVEIAEFLSVTPARVSQMLRQALNAVAHRLGARPDEPRPAELASS
jgi:RNA polymerase sigma factor (sigma-70 family)